MLLDTITYVPLLAFMMVMRKYSFNFSLGNVQLHCRERMCSPSTSRRYTWTFEVISYSELCSPKCFVNSSMKSDQAGTCFALGGDEALLSMGCCD